MNTEDRSAARRRVAEFMGWRIERDLSDSTEWYHLARPDDTSLSTLRRRDDARRLGVRREQRRSARRNERQLVPTA